jgi:hypothetical protein
MSEAALERACRAHATSRGARSAKLQGGIVGDPDRIFFVEFKQPDGRLTPRQKIVHEEYLHLGHPVSVIRTTLQFKVELDLKLQAAVDCRLSS